MSAQNAAISTPPLDLSKPASRLPHRPLRSQSHKSRNAAHLANLSLPVEPHKIKGVLKRQVLTGGNRFLRLTTVWG